MSRKGIRVLALTSMCIFAFGMDDMFTSIAHLQGALDAEKDIASVIMDYIEAEERRFRELRSLAEEMESHSSRALADPDLHLTNPIDAFLFVKKFTVDWDRDVQRLITDNDNVEAAEMRRLVAYCRQFLPKEVDLFGTAEALVRLQNTYQLDTEDMALGKLKGDQFTKLTASDCFELGKLRFEVDDFFHASLWLTQALKELDKNNDAPNTPNNTAQRTDILEYLSQAEFKIGNTEKALNLTEEVIRFDPDNEKCLENRQYYQMVLAGNDTSKHKEDNATNEDDDSDAEIKLFENYQALCRGENIMDIPQKHKLVCRYRTRNHPLLILSPAKEEDVYRDPWIVLYHDVISDSEIETLKERAAPRLERAAVLGRQTIKNVVDYRISKSAWLLDDEHRVVATLSARIEAITGLNMETAEDLQVGNYGIGGHYIPHKDHSRDEDVYINFGPTGNRIATFMFYMNNVETGATVFPLLGVKITPVKGSAAFWYNLRRNGEGIDATLHAGCPVLAGTKWVSNKWIHERGQEFRKPCGLSPDEFHQPS